MAKENAYYYYYYYTCASSVWWSELGSRQRIRAHAVKMIPAPRMLLFLFAFLCCSQQQQHWQRLVFYIKISTYICGYIYLLYEKRGDGAVVVAVWWRARVRLFVRPAESDYYCYYYYCYMYNVYRYGKRCLICVIKFKYCNLYRERIDLYLLTCNLYILYNADWGFLFWL